MRDVIVNRAQVDDGQAGGGLIEATAVANARSQFRTTQRAKRNAQGGFQRPFPARFDVDEGGEPRQVVDAARLAESFNHSLVVAIGGFLQGL